MTPSPQSPEPAAEVGLDRLLRDYFRSKMPAHFPELPLESATPRMQPRSPLTRSRLILAACVVAVVVGFGYLLSIAPQGAGQKPVGIGGDNSAIGGVPHATPAKR